MGAHVRQPVELTIHPHKPDAPPLGLHGAHLARRRHGLAREAQRPHAAAVTGTPNNSAAVPYRIGSRHSAGSVRRVGSGSSKSQCG